MLTLKSHHSLGDLPELITANVPEQAQIALTEAVDKVAASVNRLSATEVVDRCRDAVSIVFGTLIDDRGEDLSDA